MLQRMCLETQDIAMLPFYLSEAAAMRQLALKNNWCRGATAMQQLDPARLFYLLTQDGLGHHFRGPGVDNSPS